MIKLINASNHRAIWISPEAIESVHETEDGTRICTHGDVEYVGESPEEVARKVLEYKLAMMHIQGAINNGELDLLEMHEHDLFSGLEEQKG